MISIFKALAKEPEDRFQDMGNFAKTLEKLAQDELPEPQEAGFAHSAVVEKPPEKVARDDVPETGPLVSPPPAPTRKSGLLGWTIGGGLVVIIGLAVVLCVVVGAFLVVTQPWQSMTSGGAEVQATVVGEALSTSQAAGSGGSTADGGDSPGKAGIPMEAPEWFPDDIPLLDEYAGTYTDQADEGFQMLTYNANADYDEVVTFYQGGMAAEGWEQLFTTRTEEEKTTVFSYTKPDGREATISISYMLNEVWITVMVTP